MSVFVLVIALWLSLSVGFVMGATWCGLCHINKKLDGIEQ